MKRVLLLGSSGKMGTALSGIFDKAYDLVCLNSKDFNALEFNRVKTIINKFHPDIIINTVAYLGIDPSEEAYNTAFQLNTIYPRLLSHQANEIDSLLIHFSTDAVFNDEKKNFYVESDTPAPLNIYGITKYGGDCSVISTACKYYIIRVPILFGETAKNSQFVEKMLQKVTAGKTTLKIADDIISSPTYSRDVALRIKYLLEANFPIGVYHVSNAGKASLYDLMSEIINNLGIDISVFKASYQDFPFTDRKNTHTPLISEKLEPMRHWRDAVSEYCSTLGPLKGVI